jgi:uncharacterized protein (TIGR00369 family)
MTVSPPHELADALRAPGQLTERMGIEVTEWNPERLVGTMPVDGNRQPYGLLNGGASCVLAETLGTLAALLNAPEGKIAVGVDINATHHRPARAGVVTGVCTPAHRGRTTATYEIVISDESGRRTCTARLTCALIARDA